MAVHKEAGGEPRLVTWVVPRREAGAWAGLARVLQRHLAERLPSQMVPTGWEFLERLPLLPSGKVDRAALPRPGSTRLLETPYLGPRNATEARLAALFSEVLGVPEVGVEDDFFALGGHSLAATRLLAGIHATWGAELKLRAVFTQPTVAQLAATLATARQGAEPSVIPALPRGGLLPLSSAQERMLFLERLSPGMALHHVPVVFRLSGPLDVAALRASLDRLFARHEGLRLRLQDGAERARAAFLPPGPFPLEEEDLSHGAEADHASRLDTSLRELLRRPMPLEHGPLIHGSLFRLGAREHVLALVVHHLVVDRWSTEVLWSELRTLYSALRAGSEAALPPLPIQYADWAAWQRQRSESGALAPDLDWWASTLAELPDGLWLGGARRQQRDALHRGGRHEARLPPQVLQAVRALAERSGTSVFVTLLAAFQLLLRRYSEQDDIVVGTPVANRGQPQVAGVAGLFVNTVVVRTRFEPALSFHAVLARVREAALGALEHQEAPFDKVVERLGRRKGLERAPFFQVMFVHQERWRGPLDLDGVRCEPLSVPTGLSTFDLTLIAEEQAEGLALELEYAADLFAPPFIARLAEHFSHLLVELLARPDAPVDTLPLAPPAGLEQARAAGRGPTVPRATGDAAHRRFSAQVARTPEAIALVDGERSYSYRQLEAWSHRIANALLRRGVRPGMRVALCMERSAAYVAALLGCLKAGAAWVPMNPADPLARLQALLEDARPAAAVVARAPRGLFDSLGEQVLELGGEVDALAGEPETPPPDVVTPHHPAYVIYTSGSTGTPKGVVVPHRALLNHLAATCELFGLAPGDRVLQFAALTFDAAVEEILPTLASGATLVLRTEAMLDSAPAFLRACDALGISVLDLPTGWWHHLVARREEEDLPLPAALRLVVIGGERALPGRVAAWRHQTASRPSAPRLLNTYGPTEAAIVALQCELSGAEGDEAPIGVPLPNVEALVLDARLQPVPWGMPGELCLGGACLADGYLGRGALTAERFVPHPFSRVPGERLYRTGDKVRWREDGRLEFLGRLDEQVKVRGFRVEPAEAADALTSHPSVADAVVAAEAPEGGAVRLVAWVAARPGTSLDVVELQRHLRDRLPDYLVPSLFVPVERIPRLSSGKPDRRALPPSSQAAQVAGPSFEPPRTPLEAELCALWGELLGQPQVGVHDDFFEAGGHSLSAVELVWRIQARYGVEVSLRALFQTPTVEGLARLLEEAGPRATPSVLAPVAGPRRTSAPLSTIQEGIWLQEQLAPGLYNVPIALRLRGALEVPALEQALAELVRRHAMLRVRPRAGADGVEQVLDADFTPVLTRRELQGPHALGPYLEEAAARPLLAENAPLFAVELLRLDAEEHVLLLRMHHLVVDGWSVGLLLRELDVLYTARLAGRAPELAPVSFDFLERAFQERSRPPEARTLAFWKQRLEAVPPVGPLPADRAPAGRREARARTDVTLHLPARRVAALRALGRQRGTTLFTTLVAALEVWLARHTGEQDLVVGVPVLGRDDAGTRLLVAPLADALPLRVRLPPGACFNDVLALVRDAVLEGWEHRGLTFPQLVKHLAPPRLPGVHPFFQVMFDLEETQGDVPASLGPLALEEVRAAPPLAKFDLAVSARVLAEGAALELQFAADLFERATAHRLAARLERLLESLCEETERPLRLLPLLPAGERRFVVEDTNDTQVRWSQPVDLPALFAAQARRTPDAPAVTSVAGARTYAQVRRHAARVAAALRRHGVGAEQPVALYLDRDLELPSTILGIWQAGGVYVPLDPMQPPARLQRILDECGARVLVTRAASAGALGGTGRLVLTLEELETAAADAGEAPAVELFPEQAAYVFFTSGSTGQPKGIVGTHQGIANRVLWSLGVHPVGPGEALLQLASIGFDIALWEMFGPLVAGGRLVVGEPGMQRSLDRIAELIASEHVTTIHFVPSLLDLFLESPEAARALTVRQVICGGERLAPELLQRFLAASTAKLHHAYGPTEAAISVAHWDCRSPGAPAGVVPLGRPIANARLYVLDEALEPVGVGVPGEAWIGGGLALARGYLGAPAATAERFLPDPHAAEPGARMYRTGDRVRRLADGTLEFLGRLDAQLKIRGVRVEPAEVEAALREHPEVRQAAIVVEQAPGGAPGLRACVVPVDRAARTGEAWRLELRGHLATRLPDAMVPRTFVLLDALPITANGKLDLAALRQAQAVTAESESTAGTARPRTEAEQLLASIWAELLSRDAVGIHDDFFQLGGDSIAIIRMLSRARARGLQLEVRQVFATPTVAALAAAATQVGPAHASPSRDGDAHVPLTPVQARFFALAPVQPHHANQALLLSLAPSIAPGVVRAALEALAARHEGLRLRFRSLGNGRWEQRCEPEARAASSVRLETVPAGAEGPAARREAFTARAAGLQAELDLERGPVLAALLEEGPEPALLLVAHHLVIDHASWFVLLGELEAACEQLERGEALLLPLPAMGYARWATALHARANASALDEELEAWLRVLPAPPPLLPLDFPEAADTEGTAAMVAVELDAARTARLLEGARAHRLQVDEVLLAAVALAVGEVLGMPRVLVDRELHGRDALEGLDVFQTVGWFTTVHPVLLTPGASGDLGAVLRAVKEQLRWVPDRGRGFGLLRYLREGDARVAALAARDAAAIGFNYLGRMDGGPERGRLTHAGAAPGPSVAAANPRAHALEVSAWLRAGVLRVEWEYGPRHRPETAGRLAEAFGARLEALAHQLQRPDAVGYTPSDFPLARLDARRLEAALGRRRDVVAVYPLTPLQSGMLLSQLVSAEQRSYFTQLVFELEGPVDERALREAWDAVGAHYEAFRTGFLWEALDEPHQFVRASVPLRWERRDLAGLDEPAARDALEALLREDRKEGFRLDEPSLSRVHLLARSPSRRWMVWSHHHIVFDGWSLPQVLAALARAYAQRLRGEPVALPPAPPFSEYVRWLQGRDVQARERFWRELLAGMPAPTPLVRLAPGAPRGPHRALELALPPGDTSALRTAAERLRLTLHSVVLGTWALLLRQYTRRSDLVLGVVMSARPPAVPDIERMVGLCLNTLPLRLQPSPDRDLTSFFSDVQERMSRMQEHVDTPLSSIQAWAGRASGEQLFDHIVVFESYPGEREGDWVGTGVQVRTLKALESTEYPLVVTVLPGDSLTFDLTYSAAVDAAAVERIARDFVRLLTKVGEGLNR